MPFTEISKQQQRQKLAYLVLEEGWPLARVCQKLGVSRPTGYRWVQRADEGGLQGLQEESRRPHHLGRFTPAEVQAQVQALKEAHPSWGAKKLWAKLWPAGCAPVCVRTVDRLLARQGWTRPRGTESPAVGRFERGNCNELRQMDFKGLARGVGYQPLSVLDDHSRYCLGLVPLPHRSTEAIWGALWELFGAYGLPEAILSDNGECFNNNRSPTPTALEARLWRLGIATPHGRARHPQTQGKVERFHQTLVLELGLALYQPSLEAARGVFDDYVHGYNWERPHEAVGLRVPGAVYQSSLRSRPAHLPAQELAPRALTRKVGDKGVIAYRGQAYCAGRGLMGEQVEIRPEAEGEALYYAGVRIASLETLKV